MVWSAMIEVSPFDCGQGRGGCLPTPSSHQHDPPRRPAAHAAMPVRSLARQFAAAIMAQASDENADRHRLHARYR
jgi:hypothetical protein